MRGFTSLVVLFSYLTIAFARPREAPKSPISLRQHHVSRALLDVCANVDLALALGHILGIDGKICLCLSAFPLNLELYTELGALLDIPGLVDINALLEAVVGKSGRQCTYPLHSKPQCSAHDPCDFTCHDGYTKQGRQCVCKSPDTECNGKCGSHPNGCSSSVPRSLAGQTRNVLNSHPTTLKHAKRVCGSNEVCGVYSNRDGFECVDVKSDLESCGGCIIPSPFSRKQSSSGRDCSSIANSLNVSCDSGRCIVEKCMENYDISITGDSCIQRDPHAEVGVAYTGR